jgi:hypothetical protein
LSEDAFQDKLVVVVVVPEAVKLDGAVGAIAVAAMYVYSVIFNFTIRKASHAVGIALYFIENSHLSGSICRRVGTVNDPDTGGCLRCGFTL